MRTRWAEGVGWSQVIAIPNPRYLCGDDQSFLKASFFANPLWGGVFLFKV